MLISKLTITGLRNIQTLTIEPAIGINQITGANGAGKTTVLEGLYLLSSGRSFRTRKTPRLLSANVDDFSIRVEFSDPDTGIQHQAGIQKTRAGETSLKLDYQSLNSIIEVTRLLPVKIVSPDSHKLVQEGPDQRREYLDWGVFHVEQSFLQVWKQYRRALNQRNQVLKMHRQKSELAAWDRELAVAGEIVHQLRRKYVENLQPVVDLCTTRFGMSQTIMMKYRAGWSADTTLIDALTQEQQQDIPPAFTTVGPHRAELALSANGQPAREILSRGEQKLLVYALHFAQLELFQQATTRRPIVLLDDLSAELDANHCQKVLQQLYELGFQAFITGNTAISLDSASDTEIHQLAQGKVSEVI